MDPSSLAIQKSIRLPDCNPSQHDCRFLPDSHVIATTGGNLISYVDIKTERVDVDRVENLAADSGIRHFAMASDGSLIMQANRITDLGSRISIAPGATMTVTSSPVTIRVGAVKPLPYRRICVRSSIANLLIRALISRARSSASC